MRMTSWISRLRSQWCSNGGRRRERPLTIICMEPLEVRVLLATTPVIGNLGSTVNYTEGAPPILVAPTATVTDAGGEYAKSVLKVTTTNGAGADLLGIVPGAGVGLAPNGVVMYSPAQGTAPAQVATVAGGAAAAPLVVTFNTTATQGAIKAVLDQVAYGHGASTLQFPDRTISYQITDGAGTASAVVSKSIHVNPAPVIGKLGEKLNYTEGAPPMFVAPQATLDDASNGYANAKLTVTTTNGAAGDQLGIQPGRGIGLGQNGVVMFAASQGATAVQVGTVTGGAGATPLVVTFNASATKAAEQAVLVQIAYGNGTSTLAIPDRNVTFKFVNGSNVSSAVVGKPIHVNPAPVIGKLGEKLNFVEGAPPILVAPQATLNDASNSYANATLTVATTNGGPGDQLGIQPGLGVKMAPNGVVMFASAPGATAIQVATLTGGAGAAPLVVKFNASATKAAEQAVLNQIAYGNGTSTLQIPNRNITFKYTGGNKVSSVPVGKPIHIIPAPVIGQFGGTVTYVAGGSAALLAANATISNAAGAWANSKLTVGVNGQATDRLTITTGSGLTIGAGNTLSFNGTAIGTFAGGSGTTALVITFNASATQAAVQSVLNHVAFSSTSATPGLADRLAQFSFVDGNNVPSALYKKLVKVTN